MRGEVERNDRRKERVVTDVDRDLQDRRRDLYRLDSDRYVDDDSMYDVADLDDDWYYGEGMEEVLPSDELVESIGDICTCLEKEPVSTPLPPPPPAPRDPVEEFIKRMESDIDREQLEGIFQIDGIGPRVSEVQVTAVNIWLCECARRQEGYVGPRNIKHFLCPDLQDSNNCHDRYKMRE